MAAPMRSSRCSRSRATRSTFPNGAWTSTNHSCRSRSATGRPVHRCSIGKTLPGGFRMMRKLCCSSARSGCVKQPAPRTCAWPAALLSTAWPTDESCGRPASTTFGFSPPRAMMASRLVALTTANLALLKKPRSSVMTHAFLGAPYSDEDARAAADKWLVRLQTMNTPSKNICRDTARLLAEGHVFAWFQGGSEFGPRALGNRSILADPRKAEMKDKLNKRVKHRQAFRPFAPVVLAERQTRFSKA